MDIIKLRAKDASQFESEVFGGWSFLEHYPHILTEGVDVFLHENGMYYMVKDGKPVDGVRTFTASSSFFSQEEVDNCMEVVK